MMWWTLVYSTAAGCLSWDHCNLSSGLNQEWGCVVLSEIYPLFGYLYSACRQLTRERINQSPTHTFYLRTKLYINPVKAFNVHYRWVSQRSPSGWWTWDLLTLFYQCHFGASCGFVPAAALEREITTCTSWQIPTRFEELSCISSDNFIDLKQRNKENLRKLC